MVKVIILNIYFLAAVSSAYSQSQFVERIVKMNTCEIKEVSTRYLSEEPSLIFFNGIPATSLIYESLIKELNGQIRNRLIRVDLPGTGRSLVKGRLSWSSQRKCVAEYLARKNNYILVLHDIAGPVVLPLLQKLEGVKGLIVLNTLINTQTFTPPFPMNIFRAPILGDISASITGPLIYKTSFKKIGLSEERRNEISKKWIRKLYEEVSYQNGLRRVVKILRGFEQTHATDVQIKNGLQFDLPKTIIWGDADEGLKEQLFYLNRIFPEITVKKIHGGKHFFMVDFPNEVAEHIIDFLNTHEL